MKIRQTLLLISFFVLSISGNSFCQNNLSEKKQIIKTLRTFYKAYLTELTKTKIDADGKVGIGTDYSKIELLRKIYCTKSFLIKLEKATDNGLDYDPLGTSQDPEMKDYETLKIWRDKRQINMYRVSFGYFEYDKNNIQQPIKMIILKDKGTYKIDSIIDPYWKL